MRASFVSGVGGGSAGRTRDDRLTDCFAAIVSKYFISWVFKGLCVRLEAGPVAGERKSRFRLSARARIRIQNGLSPD